MGAMQEMLEAGRLMVNVSPIEEDLLIIHHSSVTNVELWDISLSSVQSQDNK